MKTRVKRRGGGCAGGDGGGGGGGRAAGAGGDCSGAMASGGPPQANNGDDDAPSELLVPLLEEWRHVLVTHVLSRLNPTDCALLARVGKPWLAVVVANNLPRAGKGGGAVPLKLVDFLGSVETLAWAKDSGCPWGRRTFELAARHGILQVLPWVREHGCEWDWRTCAGAAEGGDLQVLMW
jgi:hypothetical protein